MTIEPWFIFDDELVADAKIFRLRRLTTRSPRTGEDRAIALVETGDWVNVVALTPEREVVLVRQFRHGTGSVTLEIPGGLVDAGERPEEAAVRELREETGHTGREVTRVGMVHPNPAFLTNRCYTYLVENCSETHALALDPGEDIEVLRLPLHRIPTEIAEGRITHALVICGFLWLAQKRPDLFTVMPGTSGDSR